MKRFDFSTQNSRLGLEFTETPIILINVQISHWSFRCAQRRARWYKLRNWSLMVVYEEVVSPLSNWPQQGQIVGICTSGVAIREYTWLSNEWYQFVKMKPHGRDYSENAVRTWVIARYREGSGWSIDLEYPASSGWIYKINDR